MVLEPRKDRKISIESPSGIIITTPRKKISGND